PSCGIPDPGPQLDPCEDRGDGLSCGISAPACDGGLASCYTGWHVSAACCSQGPTEAGTWVQKPFRRVDGSIVERAGGCAGCILAGMPDAGIADPGWCCTHLAP